MRAPRTAVVAIAVLALGILAGCSADEPAATSAVSAAPVSTTDVAFAQSMIPHHQQAIEMADLALAPGSGASPEVTQLAEQIKAAQDPEIAQMTQWLQRWGVPTAMPGATDPDQMHDMDHSGHDMGTMTMSGMMTDEQMDALMNASGEEFDGLWLKMMIEHHQGAVDMARQVQSSSDPQVSALAGDVIEGQQQEIVTMQDLLGQGT